MRQGNVRETGVKVAVLHQLLHGAPELVDRSLLHELHDPRSRHQLCSVRHGLRDGLADVELARRGLAPGAAVHHGRERAYGAVRQRGDQSHRQVGGLEPGREGDRLLVHGVQQGLHQHMGRRARDHRREDLRLRLARQLRDARIREHQPEHPHGALLAAARPVVLEGRRRLVIRARRGLVASLLQLRRRRLLLLLIAVLLHAAELVREEVVDHPVDERGKLAQEDHLLDAQRPVSHHTEAHKQGLDEHLTHVLSNDVQKLHTLLVVLAPFLFLALSGCSLLSLPDVLQCILSAVRICAQCRHMAQGR
mmetsp:Transcript_76125/g.223174  ORF Transcript_76125/g.223174 Transcript_76125/m.223174 type:complete len:307 (-) Transcript_76125:2172-3092(-)